jgi:hypothetical protein
MTDRLVCCPYYHNCKIEPFLSSDVELMAAIPRNRFSRLLTAMNWNGETESGAHIDFEASSAAFLSDFAGEESGTGMGPALVKKVVELHGGRVWVESETGAGTNFLFHHTGETAANMTVPGMKARPVD